MTNKWTLMQKIGLVLVLIGISFILFPEVIGATAIYVLAIAITGLGVYALLGSFKRSSIFLSILSLLIVGCGLTIFARPQIILLIIGLGCLFSGLSGVFYALSRESRKGKSIFYPLVLVLVGGYATFNASAAGVTLVMILGVLCLVIGAYLWYKRDLFKLFSFNVTEGNQGTSYTYDPFKQQQNKVDDDIIDVDYKESDQD